MDDDRFLDERFSAARSPLDDALIGKYCVGIEDRIRMATSAKAAQLVVYDACREFERECGSEIIPLFLKRHVNELYEKYWGKP